MTRQRARERFTIERIAFHDRKKGMLTCHLVRRAYESRNSVAASQREIDNMVASAPSSAEDEHVVGAHRDFPRTRKYLYEINKITRNSNGSST